MKIIFMGTPDFAVPALMQLVSSREHEVVAVFTQEPKPKGRGLKLTYSPVYLIAKRYNIPIYTPESLKSGKVIDLINSLEAELIVVVAYGLIVPADIITAKKFGCLNIHPSRLPEYRGAAPLQRIIINGETETSVCIIQMDEKLDTGAIILQEDFTLPDRISFTELHDKCANLGGRMLIEVLKKIDELPRIKQGTERVSYAHKLTKEEGKINWQESASLIDRKIRGMNPWPGVFFVDSGKIIKIITASYRNISHSYKPGQLINDQFEVACGSGILQLITLKPEGKPVMAAEDYLKGRKHQAETIIFS